MSPKELDPRILLGEAYLALETTIELIRDLSDEARTRITACFLIEIRIILHEHQIELDSELNYLKENNQLGLIKILEEYQPLMSGQFDCIPSYPDFVEDLQLKRPKSTLSSPATPSSM